MVRKARLWIGVTLFAVIAFNYAAIGFPLLKKSASIKDKYKVTLIKQAKSGEMFKNSEDEYMLDIFRREKSALDRNILILNCVAISLSAILLSWTLFGLILHKERKERW